MESFINPEEYLEEQQKKIEAREGRSAKKFPEQPERDVLEFLLDHAPLERWERDVLEVIRDEAYYFVPQMQTKIMNEGWASYWHSQHDDREGPAMRREIIDYADNNAGVHGDERRAASTRTSSASSSTATSRSAGTRASSARSGRSATTSTRRSNWDLRLGLGQQEDLRGARALQRRHLHRRVPHAGLRAATRSSSRFGWSNRNERYEIETREFKEVKEKLLFQLTNAGNPFIYVEDANYENRGELLLAPRAPGHRPARRLREGDAARAGARVEAAGARVAPWSTASRCCSATTGGSTPRECPKGRHGGGVRGAPSRFLCARVFGVCVVQAGERTNGRRTAASRRIGVRPDAASAGRFTAFAARRRV